MSKILAVSMIAMGLTACGNLAQPGQQIVGYNSNGQPIYGNPGQYPQTGGNNCISSFGQPLSLSFTASGITSQPSRFFAGNIPQYGTAAGNHGQLSLSGGYMQQMPGAVSLSKPSQNGSIQLMLSPQSGSVSGMIQISSQALMQTGVMNSMMYSGGQYGGQYGSPAICVTQMALDVVYIAAPSYGGYGQSTGSISQALVYLTFNNGMTALAPVAL